MTTPPKVRRFNLSRSESPVAAARDAARAQPGPDPAGGGASAGGVGGPVAANAPGAAPMPAVRIEVRRGEGPARADAAGSAGGAAAGAIATGGGPVDAAAAADSLFDSDDGFGDLQLPGAGPVRPAGSQAGAPAGVSPGPSTGGAAAPPTAPTAPGATGSPGVAGAATPAITPAATPPADPQDALAAVRAENLTSRQLRMAARIAAMHEIEAASEYEAVVALRARGIDPFHRGAVGRILSGEGNRAQAGPSPQVPARVAPAGLPQRTRRQEIAPIPPGQPAALPGAPALPSREALTEERRAAEIYRIQRDIARRRQRRLAMLMVRLAFFVGLPTLIAGWYYFTQATPLYATHAQFLIQQAENTGGGELGGLFSGTQLATNPDSVSVQSYLTSRDAMMRLDEDLGFRRAFQDPSVDALLRLPPDATMEQVYGVYKDSVKISYDPTEGVINMEVIAPDPKLSEQFSLALIRYAEGQVDQMTARLRDDQMKGAIESYADAEKKVQEAQARVQKLQEQMGVLDPTAEGGVVMGQIATLEGQLSEKRLELGQLQANARPNQSRVQGVQGDIARLERMIADTRAQLTESQGSRASLAAITGELRIADSDLATRQQLLAAAAQQMETTRIEANKQVRYLSLSVAPVPPDEATYPKALQNTIVAFLIFAGIYLMLSLTASILREQVSS